MSLFSSMVFGFGVGVNVSHLLKKSIGLAGFGGNNSSLKSF